MSTIINYEHIVWSACGDTTLHSCYMKNTPVFSQSDARNFSGISLFQVWVCYQFLCQLLTSSGLMKNSYLPLTQYGHACQRSTKNTRKKPGGYRKVSEKSSLSLFYFKQFYQ